jgi:hypothetical protein
MMGSEMVSTRPEKDLSRRDWIWMGLALMRGAEIRKNGALICPEPKRQSAARLR